MATLRQFAAGKSISELNVERTEFSVNTRGEKIALLWLAQPIEAVKGSQFVPDEGGSLIPVMQYGVDVVTINERDWDLVEMPESGKGKVTSDLMLDVAKQTGDVFLTSESFATFGRNKSGERRTERNTGVLARMSDRKAKVALKNANPKATGTENKPETVTEGAEQ